MSSKKKIKGLVVEHIKDERVRNEVVEYINNLTSSHEALMEKHSKLRSDQRILAQKHYTPRVSKRAFQ
jgi:hypothetical protein